jgi:hypothetical protein
VLLLVRTTKREEAAGRMDGMMLLLVDLRASSVDTRPLPEAGATPWHPAGSATTTLSAQHPGDRVDVQADE